MNRAALALFRAGHVPVMPLSLGLVERCDACLRVGGPWRGADEEAACFRSLGRPVYAALEEVPAAR